MIVDIIGQTPIVQLALPGPGVGMAKLEMQNLFAMKDRVARQVIRQARETGALLPGAPIIESSSGTMALGLALVGRAMGHPVHIVTDPRIDPITMGKLTALGCEVHVVQQMTGAGWQSARLELLAQLVADLPHAFWPRQYSNPENPAAYADVAQEVLQQVGEIDVLVGAVGSGGSLCGTARALRKFIPDLYVVAVDCVGSMIFAQPDWPLRRQSGLGNSMQAPNVDYQVIDEVHWLSDDEAFMATRALAAEQQLFAGNSSGSVYRVITYLTKLSAAGTRVLGIFPDRGDRYLDSIFHCQDQVTISEEPATVTYGTEVARWSRSTLDRPRPTVVFVESNTTGTGMLALAAANRLGRRAVLLTADPTRYPSIPESTATVVDCDTNSVDAITATLMQMCDRSVGLVTTTSDYSLVAAAQVNRRLGLSGPDPDVMRLCRNKAAVRRALDQVGVRQGQWALVTAVEQVSDVLGNVGFPCVVKPTEDSGSNLVRVCSDIGQVQSAVNKVLAVKQNVRGQETPREALIEQYLVGPEFSVEVLCDGDGVHVIGVTAKQLGGITGFVEIGHLFPAPISEIHTAELGAAACEAIVAVGWRWGAAHVEFRLTEHGPRLVEINPRLAGGMIPELVRLATGMDVIEQQLRSNLAMPLLLQGQRQRVAGIKFVLAPSSGLFAGVTGTDRALHISGIDRVEISKSKGDKVIVSGNVYDRVGYLTAVGDRPDLVQQSLESAAAELNVVIDPLPSGAQCPA